MKTRVFIADDHPVLRAGLTLLLNAQPDIEVVGEAGDSADALAKIVEAKPDVALVDLTMPGSGGLDVIRALHSRCPRVQVLVLTMHEDPSCLEKVLKAGGAGYVVKSAADTELLRGIRAVAQGGAFVYLSPESRESPADRSRRDDRAWKAGDVQRLRRLSERERAVLKLVAQGYTNREIADHLGIGVKSVETYRARLMLKLGLQGRVDLVTFSLRTGVLGSVPEPSSH